MTSYGESSGSYNIPRVAITEDDLAQTDRAIQTAITFFEKYLPDDPLLKQKYHETFTTGGTNDTAKINLICWVWGEKHQHGDAANLRALDFVRSMKRTMLTGMRDFEETHHFAIGDDPYFWQMVDAGIMEEFRVTALQQGIDELPHISMEAPGEFPVAYFNGLMLTRVRSAATDGLAQTVSYRLT